MSLVTASCALKSIFHAGTDIEFHEDRLLCASITQGSPLFVYLDIPRGRNEDALLFGHTRWEYEAWLLYKNLGKCFYVKKEGEGKDPKKIIPLDKEVVSVRTEKDQLVFGVDWDAHDILVETDPIYADRTQKVEGAQIEYTVLPVKVHVGKKTIPGSAFYQHVAYVGEIRHPSSPSRLDFLRCGTSCYLWDRAGNFWFIEHLVSENVNSTFAVTQDPRGEWQETYEVNVTSPEIEQTAGGSHDTKISLMVDIPAWRMEAHLTSLRTGDALPESAGSPDQKEQSDSLEKMLEGFPDHPSLSETRLYQVEGSVQMENENRTVYGIVQFCCPKKR